MELDTLQFLDLVWGEEECYVDLPSKSGGHWIPWIAEWPADRVLVGSRVRSCLEDEEDIYFSVARFRSKGRRLADALPTPWLWADLDRVDPVFLDSEYLLPTLAWESSPGRYQALWRLTRPLKPSVQTKLNQRLSYALTADRGGWDLTQVLRPIGTKNFKYNPVADVTLLWHDEELIYKPKEILDAVVRIEEEEAAADGRGRYDLVTDARAEIQIRLPARARRLLATPAEMVVVGERSARLWELECLLAEAGLDEEAIFTLVWPTAWNKHREVRTGEDRLRKEIAKALAQVEPKSKPKKADEVVRGARPRDAEEMDLERDEKPTKSRRPRSVSPFVDYATFISTNIETPRWLIQDIWSSSSHGIIGGEPKTSKSSFCLAMGLSVATGRPFLGKFDVASPGPVILVQEENSPWLVQDRLRKTAHKYGLLGKKDIEVTAAPKGSIAEHVVRLNFPDEAPMRLLNNYGFDMTDPEDLDMLENEVRRLGAAMVIIDPAYLVMPGVNLSQSHEVGPYLQWLMALRHNHNCAVVLVHHWGKSNENQRARRAGQRLLGSGLFHGWLESGLYMEQLESPLGTGTLRVRVEREFRNTAPMTDLEVVWKWGEPGELDMDVEVYGFNIHDQVLSVIERLIPQSDERGLNARAVIDEAGLPRSPESRRQVALIAREGGYKVRRKKYPRGYAYIIFKEGSK